MAADPLLILIICVTDDAPLAFVCMIECVCLMLLVCVCIKPYDSATIDSLCANRDTIIATRPTISIRLNVRRLQNKRYIHLSFSLDIIRCNRRRRRHRHQFHLFYIMIFQSFLTTTFSCILSLFMFWLGSFKPAAHSIFNDPMKTVSRMPLLHSNGDFVFLRRF